MGPLRSIDELGTLRSITAAIRIWVGIGIGVEIRIQSRFSVIVEYKG